MVSDKSAPVTAIAESSEYVDVIKNKSLNGAPEQEVTYISAKKEPEVESKTDDAQGEVESDKP